LGRRQRAISFLLDVFYLVAHPFEFFPPSFFKMKERKAPTSFWVTHPHPPLPGTNKRRPSPKTWLLPTKEAQHAEFESFPPIPQTCCGQSQFSPQYRLWPPFPATPGIHEFPAQGLVLLSLNLCFCCLIEVLRKHWCVYPPWRCGVNVPHNYFFLSADA